jgi:hypothetical protein
MIRASEPPMKERRSSFVFVHPCDFMLSSSLAESGLWDFRLIT